MVLHIQLHEILHTPPIAQDTAHPIAQEDAAHPIAQDAAHPCAQDTAHPIANAHPNAHHHHPSTNLNNESIKEILDYIKASKDSAEKETSNKEPSSKTLRERRRRKKKILKMKAIIKGEF